MSATSIEWATDTWNPTTGCDRCSPGCDNCYALTMARRLKAMGQPAYQRDGDPRTSGPGFGLTVHPDRLDLPLHWRKPARIFVNSMSDLFHPDVPSHFIASVWRTMGRSPQHTFQILTKRPQRMRAWVQANNEVTVPTLPNVWLGVSVENQRYADLRIPLLLATPAAVRFLSVEPLLGPVNLSPWFERSFVCTKCGWGGKRPDLSGPGFDGVCPRCPYAVLPVPLGIGWVIVGGESGPGARPMHPSWARTIRDQCAAAGVPFLFKQWGEWLPESQLAVPWLSQSIHGTRRHLAPDGDDRYVAGESAAVYRVGKKAAGREFDGRTWDEYPA